MATVGSAVDGLFGAITTFFQTPPAQPSNNVASKGSIGSFIHKVNLEGLAHSHLFLVSIGPRGGTASRNIDLVDKMNLFCHATSIPALNVMTAPYRENAAHYEVPYGHSYEPVTMNFYGDANMAIKDYFDNWYSSIVNSKFGEYPQASFGNNRLQFMDQIGAEVIIYMIPKEKVDRVYGVKLINAYPKSIGNIDLNHQNTDIISFPIQFTYERLEQLKPTANIPLIGQPPAPRSFPLNVWDTATGAAAEIIQAATKTVENVSGQVADVLGGVAEAQNEMVSTIRGRVTPTPTPPHHENVS